MKDEKSRTPPEHCNVAIVGGGPAGLATATELARSGITDVVVLERESLAGGIPRHCGHSPFGMREFGRCYNGPRYAKNLVRRARNAGVDVCLNTTVVSAGKDGILTLSTRHGVSILNANRVVLSTGARETPRAARLVSGQRPLGIVTTGALQSMVYLQQKKPFTRALIIGTELISLSALLTCRHANITPLAMLEKSDRMTAHSGLQLLPKLLGVPIYFQTRISEIIGTKRVEGIRMLNACGTIEDLQCDGIVFSGRFTAESSLARNGHLQVDTHSGGPVIDQFGRCSDPVYFATGNLLHPVETAGWCWKEGVHLAHCVRLSLAGRLDDGEHVPIKFDSPMIKYIVPQNFFVAAHDTGMAGMKHLQLRFTKPAKGRLSLHLNSREIRSKLVRTMPERRILLALPDQLHSNHPSSLAIKFTQY